MKMTVMMEEVAGPSPSVRTKQHPQGVWGPPSCLCTWLSAHMSLEWGLTQEISRGLQMPPEIAGTPGISSQPDTCTGAHLSSFGRRGVARHQPSSPLRYLYSRRIDVSLSSVKCLHKLASAYQAEQLQSYCGHLFAILIPQDPSFRTPLELYAYALATRDPVLEEICVQFLAWNFGALTQAEAWLSVPPGLLQDLLSRTELVVPSELVLLRAVDEWSRERSTSHKEVEGLVEKVRFPMMPPRDLFSLQFNLSLYWSHEALLQKKILQALEFHTVPFELLAQYWGLNLTEDAYQPRLYTSPTWSESVMSSSYSPYRSFQTPQHPSFLFQASSVSWSLVYLPTLQSCWNYGFSCSSDDPPLLALSKSSYSSPTIGYENRALLHCEGSFVADVIDFKGWKALIPSALSTNSSRSTSLFPCPAGFFSRFQVVIRPFYLTNSTGMD